MIKKFVNRIILKKTIALSTAAAFLFTGVFGNVAYSSLGMTNINMDEINFNSPIIPLSMGKITSAKYFDSEDIVINIQDLHCHAETQRKISSIIGYIDGLYKLDKVYLEGAFNNVDTSWLSAFNNSKEGTKVLESMVDLGRLSGTEYYSIMNNKKNFISGIENEQVYKENIRLLNEIISFYPEIEAICAQLENRIKEVKRDYSGRQARKLDRLITAFHNKKIDSKYYYETLSGFADKLKISLDKYPNVASYIKLLKKAQSINDKKTVSEFKSFTAELKNKLPYKEYVYLLKKSGDFNNLEDISTDLINLDGKYNITRQLKLQNFAKFLVYLDFNRNINPVNFVKEEELFINDLFTKMGRTEYEREVAFMSDFVPKIKQYFTANISADEYYVFEESFSKFKKLCPSYFNDGIIKNLDRYQNLLSKYHKNNLKRDKIFAEVLIPEKNLNNKISVSDTKSAVNEIKNNISRKNIKLVVTGGFHTRGLEKIFEKQKISYVIITPKITQPIEEAKQIYLDTITYYSKILKNTINLEPLTQEPLNVSFPKILNSIFILAQSNAFEGHSAQEVKEEITDFIQKNIIQVQSSLSGDIEITGLDIASSITDENIQFFVEYKDNANKGMKSKIEYIFSDGQTKSFATINTEKTVGMIKKYISGKRYASPSIELEPSNSARKQIGRLILQPLSQVAGKAVSFMSAGQLHMTVGYDSSMTDMSDKQMDMLISDADKTADIFTATEKLGKDFSAFNTTLSGSLKLMPDGVIIYEITDLKLIERMLNLRAALTEQDLKYKTPSIVHMTIGRISDASLLDGSLQSKQHLAQLLEKLNEKIYEINKQNALSKIKTSFTIKGGYVSVTGNEDFVTMRITPKAKSLVIFKNLFKNSGKTIKFIYESFIAPIAEEFIFRYLPFVAITGLFVSNPVTAIPALVTAVSGIFIFPLAHILFDKISDGKIRNFKSLAVPSTILTASFLAVSAIFPGMPVLAFLTSAILHSVNNIFALKDNIKNLNILTVFKSNAAENYLDDNLKSLISNMQEVLEDLNRDADNKTVGQIKSIAYEIEQAGLLPAEEKYKIVEAKTQELFEILIAESKKEKNAGFGSGKYFTINYLLEPLLKISVNLKNREGRPLFDSVFNFMIKEATTNTSNRFLNQLLSAAQYFYSIGEQKYTHKILNALYENKSLVKAMTDYGRFAVPLPSPFAFKSVEQWEQEIDQIIKKSDLYSNWYTSELEMFFGMDKKYAYAVLKSLYKNGKQTTPPYLNCRKQGYEWSKEFYTVCGDEEDIFIVEQSVPLLKFEDIKNFTENAGILETNNIYLNDIISRIQYLKKEQYNDIAAALKETLLLSREKQLEAVTKQMNKFYEILFQDEDNIDIKTLELLAPVFSLIKHSDTGNTLLIDSLQKVRQKIRIDESGSLFKADFRYGSAKKTQITADSLVQFVPYLYIINREEALDLVKFIYSDKKQREREFGIGWKPVTVKDAYSKIPESLRQTITSYEDLELFYDAAGLPFDSADEQSSIYNRENYVPEYEHILFKLPTKILEAVKGLNKSTRYFRSLKTKRDDMEQSGVYFDALDKILENNILSLSEINNLNGDSIYDAVYFIEEMISYLTIIDKEHGTKAKTALENIKKNIKESKTTIEEQAKLKSWNPDQIDEIKELHTLINAIHQTSIADFMALLKYSKIAGRKITLKEGYVEHFSFYDCSDKTLSMEIKDLIANLSDVGVGQVSSKEQGARLIAKDNKLIWTKQLGAHSVDILVDMNEGIRVNFHDSGRGDGNALRVVLLASLLSQSGFEITSIDTRVASDMMDDSIPGTCEVKAVYSASDSLNVGETYADLFIRAVNIVGSTTNLDYSIEGNDVDKEKHEYGTHQVPHLTVDDFKKIKNSEQMPKGFELVESLASEWKGRFLGMKKKMKDQMEKQADLLKVYEYLNIKKEDRNPWTITRKYIEGKLNINKDTEELEQNKNYDGINDLLKAVNLNVDETLRQAQLINLLDYDKLYFETEGYIGGLIAVSGVLRLNNNGWLSIKGAVDKERKRMKCALVEYVDFDGGRKILSYQELLDLLKEEGYAVKMQQPRSKSEKEATIKTLEEKIIRSREAIYIRGRGVSGHQEGYISAQITYDKDKVGENSMWVASYTSPEDVETIIKAKGLITTGGGMLSHANITARENNKTAILSSGQWKNGKLEVVYYLLESGIEEKEGYQTQRISEHKLALEEGDVILANGATGRILLFRGINNKDINKIQKAIDKNNIRAIKQYLQEHKNDSNIKRIVEYIFLQTVWNEEKSEIIDLLLGWQEDGVIKEEILGLNERYVEEKLKTIREDILNEQSIHDEKIGYSIISRLEIEIGTIKTADAKNKKEVEKLKIEIQNRKEEIIISLGKFVSKTEREIDQILNKENITEEEKDRLAKISEMAKVWKYYYGYEGLSNKIARIDNLIKAEEGTGYETEIRGFEDILAKDVLRYGSKTTELAKMTRLFETESLELVQIPYGTGISKDVMKIFFEKAGKAEEYFRLMAEFDKAVKDANKEKANAVGQEIIKNIEEIDSDELKEHLESLLEGGKRYAVRSSGVGEDGGNHAFAGMAKTKLNVGKEEVYESIKECWESFYSQTCIEDMIKNAIVVKPALLVQEMVTDLEKAGVMFSRDERGNLTQEIVLGLGEGLVSGRVNPDHITVRARDGQIEYIRALDNMKKIVGKTEGGTRRIQLTREEKIERVIDEKMIKRLSAIAYLLEEDSGYPVDVEFAIDNDGKIYILQRRAITTLVVDEKIDYGKYKQDIEISQTLIDNLISQLNGITRYGSFTDTIVKVKETLKNLPADIDERYNIISQQINILFDIIVSYSKTKRYKDILFKYIVPFSIFVKKQGTNEFIFNSLLDMLLNNGDKEYEAIASAGDMIHDLYPLNSGYAAQIIKFLVQNDFISPKEEMPWSIKDRLKDYKYNGLKLYYFAIADVDTDKRLSDNLSKTIARLKKLSNNSKIKIDEIIKEMEFLTDKINAVTIPLLEYQINLLLDRAASVWEEDKETSYKFIEEILPVCRQIASTTNALDEKIVRKLFATANKIYEVNSDNTEFETIIDTLLFIAKKTDSLEKNDTNDLIAKSLAATALNIYTADKTSPEYAARKRKCLDIFRQFAINSPNNFSVYGSLFNSTGLVRENKGVGLSLETLEILLTAARNSKKNNIVCSIPSEDFISYSPELVDMFASAYNYIDLASVFAQCYDSKTDSGYFSYDTKRTGETGKKIAIEIIQKLFDMAKDKNNSLKTRKDITMILVRIMSAGLYKTNYDDIPVDINEVKQLAQELQMQAYLYLGNIYIQNSEGGEEYNFTPLLKFLPDSVTEQSPFVRADRWERIDRQQQVIKTKKPVITRVMGNTDTAKEEVKQLLKRFKLLQEILEYNVLVLTMLDKLKDTETYEKTMEELLRSLQQMIDRLKEINLQHGQDAQIALDNIIFSVNDKGNDTRKNIRHHLILEDWTQDNIREITGIHTLINAVHQISIADFKQAIGDVNGVGKDSIKVLNAQQKSSITAYNLSNTVNSNIVNFIAKLSAKQFPNDKIDDFICKDDIVVWTTRLNAHSVDIFFNFGDVDRGISVYYRERPVSSSDVGKKERVRYFSTILEKLGFSVDVDTQYVNGEESYGLKAVFNKDFGLNDGIDIIDIASSVVELFKFSTNIDYDLKYRHEQTGYEEVFKKLLNKFMRGEMWYGVEINNFGWKAYGYGEDGRRLVDLPRKRPLNIQSLNNVLSYLGCAEIIPEQITVEDLTDQKVVDKYFNKPIERAYIEGRVIFNEDGVLIKNEGYDIVHSIIDEVSADITEASKQSRIVNLVNNYEFKLRILGYVGDLVAVSSIMQLTNGNKLFVKGIMNPYTKRMKYARTELVTDTSRRQLTSDELTKILAYEGYEISNQEWVDNRERKRIKNLLSRNIQIIESPEVHCSSTSDGNGTYVAGNITFDKNNVSDDSILVVAYTTPDDVKNIEKAKGIITTGGGILSHAAITTREMKKPSVVLNGATWINGETEIQYYLSSGDVETIKGLQLQKVKAKNLLLHSGYRVLMNGETGTVLLFNDIDIELLDRLQTYINEDNAQAVVDFMNGYAENQNINRFVEYIYFQSIGNVKAIQILKALFSKDMPEVVKNKIKELNEGYIQEKIQNISEAIENVKSIKNVNIAYGIIEKLNNKIELIQTSEEREDMESLKKEIKLLRKKIKEELISYLQDFTEDVYKLIDKKTLDGKDVQQMTRMLNNIAVYNFFVNEEEENQMLSDMRRTLQILTPMLNDKLNLAIAANTIDIEREIISFDEINDEDGGKFGSKATELAKIYRLLKGKSGVSVPKGMGVSVNILELLFEDIGYASILDEFEAAIKDKNFDRAMELSEQISSLIDTVDSRREKIDEMLKTKIGHFVQKEIKYSVRSSGVGEDGANNAFAGMGETKLNVNYDDVYESVKYCWKSFFSERCIKYMIKNGQVVKPAVLIQEMVNSEKSGVIFSRDKYGNETIEVLYGLGEGLVSGILTPDTILVDINNGEIIEYSVINKQFQIVATANGGTERVSVGKQSKARALNSAMVKKLTEIIRLLEDNAGYPIDVEFAVKGDDIYILQRRAITTLETQREETIVPTAESQEISEIKHLITLTAGDIADGQETFVNIANPLNQEEAIPVYLKAVQGNTSVFVVDYKYIDALRSGELEKMLLKRINTDVVVANKLNSNLSILARAKQGEFGMLPVLTDMLDDSVVEKAVNLDIEKVRSMLASA